MELTRDMKVFLPDGEIVDILDRILMGAIGRMSWDELTGKKTASDVPSKEGNARSLDGLDAGWVGGSKEAPSL